MLKPHAIYSTLVLLILSSITASAQNETAKIDRSSDATITASASGERVRFTAPSSVVQIRLEVYDSAGKKLFDNEVRGGNVLDWRLQDGQAEPLGDDSYLCVVTVKSLSGRITQRIGSATIAKSSATVQPVYASQITAQQSQAIGPVEGNASLLVLKEDDNQTTTVITHDGEDGQITRGRGALSFRIGDFFSGKDTEQMRLTEEGNLGLGIPKPQFKLDIAGAIRAREGFVFGDGSTLNVNDRGALTLTNTKGAATIVNSNTRVEPAGQKPLHPPFVGGMGTPNQIAKWVAADTLGDSGITESASGFVGIGTTNPQSKLDVMGTVNSAQYNLGGSRILFASGTNTFTGINAGGSNTSGVKNSFFGNNAGTANTTGLFNSFFGFNAGAANTSGGDNSFFGYGAGLSSTTGSDNSFFGYGAGLSNTTGSGNTFVGVLAGRYNTTGRQNTFVGEFAGDANTTGLSNTFIGTAAGASNTTASLNTFVGSNAGASNTTGFFNSFFGEAAGAENTTGPQNTFLGFQAGALNTTGEENTFVGSGAGTSNTTGGLNSFFGWVAGTSNTTGSNNSYFGIQAGFLNTTGSDNSFFGRHAGRNNSASNNTFVGSNAGAANTSGAGNSFFGNNAGNANTTANDNAFFGNVAGINNTASGNSFFGSQAGKQNTTGAQNAFFGFNAGEANTSGAGNSFFGNHAGNVNTTANDNAFFGNVAGINNTASGNSFFGSQAGNQNSTGAQNAFFGLSAGSQNTTGSSNIALGTNAGGNLTTGNNNIDIGNGGVAAEANTTRIGTQGTQTSTFIAGISGTPVVGEPVFVTISGQLGVGGLSSRRFKQDIRDISNASSRLMQLRPVSFRYRPEYAAGPRPLQYGLIAEEVATVYPELVEYSADGKPQTVRYHLLSTMLLNELLRQQQKIQSQDRQLQAQGQEIKDLSNRLRQLEARTIRARRRSR